MLEEAEGRVIPGEQRPVGGQCAAEHPPSRIEHPSLDRALSPAARPPRPPPPAPSRPVPTGQGQQ